MMLENILIGVLLFSNIFILYKLFFHDNKIEYLSNKLDQQYLINHMDKTLLDAAKNGLLDLTKMDDFKIEQDINNPEVFNVKFEKESK